MGKDVAIATGKYIGDCRLTHYSALLRKALDDAGFSDVPILTNDDADFHNLHPGFRLNLLSALRIAYALPMIDILEELLRKIRPYELTKGSADAAFEQAMDAVINGLSRHGVNGAKHGFAKAIGIMKQVPYDRSHPRPTVLIVGEYLLNFHPGANHDIEAFLEQNGFEIIEARMSDVIQKSYFYRDMQVREYHLHKPLQEKLWYRMADLFFDLAHDAADKIASAHPLYDRPAVRLPELVKESDPIIHHTFDAGEGVLIPGEILPPCRPRLPCLCDPAAVRLSAEPRRRPRNLQALKGALPGRPDPSARLRSGCQLRKHREPASDADHECEGAGSGKERGNHVISSMDICDPI